jgi:hypothetical protein
VGQHFNKQLNNWRKEMSKMRVYLGYDSDGEPASGMTVGKEYDVTGEVLKDDDGCFRFVDLFRWEEVSTNLVENSTAGLCKKPVDVDKEWSDYSNVKYAMNEDGYTVKVHTTVKTEEVATKVPAITEEFTITYSNPDYVPTMRLSNNSDERKNTPIFSGVLNYFPLALAAVAQLSKKGNDKHNPGQPLHWSRGKSTDHKDCIARHLIDAGTIDPDSEMFHDVGLAWRALANLETLLENQDG